MITVNTYTGNGFRRGSMARAGSHVRIHENADAREYDDFHRGLLMSGMTASAFIRWMPRLSVNVYKVANLHKKVGG